MSDWESVLPGVAAAAKSGIEAGRHIGVQLYASLAGRPIVDAALGEARPGVPLTPDSLVLWLSATKPFGAVAILQLQEQGLLALDDRVEKFVPEFAQNGKEAITIRQCLTHTAGFRWAGTAAMERTWELAIAAVCRSRLERDWVPGEKAGYHPYSSWYMLGEIVRRITGRSFSEYVRSEIFTPLDMPDSWVGVPLDEQPRYGDRIAVLTDRSGREIKPHVWAASPEAMAFGPPGAGGYGPVRELTHLYDALLNDGERNGQRILSAESVQVMTARQREGMSDETFRDVVDWGFGLLLDSKRYGNPNVPYGYGPFASDGTFGHSGNQSSIAFADPTHQLIAAIYCNGMPGDAPHQQRMDALLSALYEDLGLTSNGSS